MYFIYFTVYIAYTYSSYAPISSLRNLNSRQSILNSITLSRQYREIKKVYCPEWGSNPQQPRLQSLKDSSSASTVRRHREKNNIKYKIIKNHLYRKLQCLFLDR